ncbi:MULTISPECIES: CxxC-x17-CxxC domain-containing protein [Polyangium]|uniref:Pseudouridylate synthase n=2 Tax=Polyangium TaxID=55 RepID=A0A4U1JDF4_9BACT|nr:MULTISPECIES: CxxC-x17-CxxC domain-containing protein [Polyangium]MDI1429274.1 zinc-ribbon domain containing protein [Polyangium sorediatum]TKD08837.1 pseudouridylate synthase [Polyangium fumosum]
MEQHRDEQINCASCGSSFLFSADDAAARAERGLSSPPTLCKPCWREKRSKSTSRSEGPARSAPRGREGRRHDPPARPGRYTGDVNEYRSPMPDPHFALYPSYGRPASPAPRGGFSPRGQAPRDGTQDRTQSPRASSSPRGPRGRGFPITCAACGVAATVPFKPAEGQKVYCRACFQAEKPS